MSSCTFQHVQAQLEGAMLPLAPLKTVSLSQQDAMMPAKDQYLDEELLAQNHGDI